jgi:hypothetical protein
MNTGRKTYIEHYLELVGLRTDGKKKEAIKINKIGVFFFWVIEFVF